MPDPRLIALDWGTSNLRARLLGDGGACLEERSAGCGVMAVPAGGFNAALVDVCGDWLRAHAVPLLASGMVGSRQGWMEAPYLACPAGPASAATALTLVPVDAGPAAAKRTLHVVPGLCWQDPNGVADVMRGEETQVWGAGVAAGGLCVLPGTHSKWVWTDPAGRIAGFRTFMTGELYSLLCQHSILGRLMDPAAGEDLASFDAGVRRGLGGSAVATHAIFAARTAGLMGTVPPSGLRDHLSGILIGAEIGGALAESPPRPHDADSTLTLIGDEGLCRRYARALQLAGRASRPAQAQATLRGQWIVANAAGLVSSPFLSQNE
jgi:2-dehydro-3-deoxygalactonokinase